MIHINPNDLIVGYKYKITEPVYDDYDEGLEPETDIVEVIKKSNKGVAELSDTSLLSSFSSFSSSS